ncbi:hypothetical protein GCM10010220_34670 [Streptomyces parvulus]|nr:hypothetical protein GCM10010220_34670 [Streptomyces parvulus]
MAVFTHGTHGPGAVAAILAFRAPPPRAQGHITHHGYAPPHGLTLPPDRSASSLEAADCDPLAFE